MAKHISSKDYKYIPIEYTVLQDRIDTAIEILQSMMPICIMPNNMLIHGTETAKTIEKAISILKGENKL